MTAQDYIQSKLEELRQPGVVSAPANNNDIEKLIFKILMSKKFRKYSANEALQQHMEDSIHLNVENNEPINITFLHGAYKLWRLDEFPEVDWAELFSLMYYTKWVKPICEIYKPGVWFDFFVDDLIVSKMNNIDVSDIHAYVDSYQEVINFLKQYQPNNLKMTITPVTSQFESEEAFYESVQRNLEKITADVPDGLPELDDSEKTMVELNVKTTDDQEKDPMWREKVYRLHNAYMITKSEPGYHKNRPEKILAFTQPLPSGSTISVGTTKDSIMKFWIGAGVLKRRDDNFKQIIYSSNQLKAGSFDFEKVNIKGLSGKNFRKIRITK